MTSSEERISQYNHSLRTMCSNWAFTRNPDSLRKLSLPDYCNYSRNLLEEVQNNPMYDLTVKPLIEKYIGPESPVSVEPITKENFDKVMEIFDEIQVQEF